MNLRQLRAIMDLFESSSAVELEIDNATVGRVRIRRPEHGGTPAVAVPAPVAAAAAPAAATPVATEEPGLAEIISPFVGTFYRAPAPEASNFVEVGDKVKPGQTLCIIEAMKLMNELEADVAGEVVEICIDNASPVEHSQVLIRIRPS
jgi:acetyl-CoA carboxylase biotin carboxyl carrier protein